MPEHKVKAKISVIELTRAGTSIEFEVFADNAKLGTIEIGHGSIGWKGRDRKGDTKRMSWSKFSSIMDTFHYGVE